MWQLLLAGERAWPLLEEWCEYLTKHHNRAISKDTWSQLLDFIKVGPPVSACFDACTAVQQLYVPSALITCSGVDPCQVLGVLWNGQLCPLSRSSCCCCVVMLADHQA